MNFTEMQDKLQRYLGYLEQDKENIELILNVSFLYLKTGEWALAQQYLDEAKRLSGQLFLTKQGIIYLETQQIDLAKETFVQAFAEEKTLESCYNLAFCLYLSRDFKAALSILNNADQEQLPEEILLLKVKILLYLQEADEAIELLEHLHKINEHAAEVSGLLALLHFDMNNSEQAETMMRKSLADNPNQYEALLVEVLLRTLNNESTIAEIESLLSVNPDECRLYFALGTLYLRNMNIDLAAEAFYKTTQIWPYFYDGWVSLGWCALYQNRVEDAESAFQQASEIKAQDADSWGGLALVHAMNNNFQKSEELVEKAFALDEHCVLANMAQILIKNAVAPEEAIEYFDKVFPGTMDEINTLLHAAIKQVQSNTLH